MGLFFPGCPAAPAYTTLVLVMLILPTTGTLLVLTPLSGWDAPTLSPYSARGLTQTLELITSGGSQTWVKRDVNGVLRSMADTRFRKYKSTITCRDGVAPALDNAWIGIEVEVQCACELNFPTGAIPARPVVSGSERTEGSVTFYRPALQMIILDIKNSFAEWQAQNDWSISLEEV